MYSFSGQPALMTIVSCVVAAESPFPLNFQLAIVHATFIAAGRGPGPTNNKKTTTAEDEEDVDATQLYPGMSYVTVKDYLDALPPHYLRAGHGALSSS
jgi:hypothetical protein